MDSTLMTNTRPKGASSSGRISHEHGPTDIPLLEETIGANLRRTAERFADREALVVRHQGYRATYGELWEQVGLAARALIANGVCKGDRVGIWAPSRYEWFVLQFATARVGAILVTINPAYKAAELEYALRKAGVSLLVMSRGLPAGRLRRDARRGASGVSGAAVGDRARKRVVHFPGRGHLDQRARARGARGACCCPKTRSTSSTRPARPGSRRARRCRTATSSTTRTSRRGLLRYTEDDRVCVPVPFYHCFGMVLGNLACTTTARAWSSPASRSTRATCLRPFTSRAVHIAVRRADDVHRRARPSPTWMLSTSRSLRTGIMAGAPCPVEVMKQVRSRMHMEQVTIACGMTETAPLSTQTAVDDPVEKRVSTVGRVAPARRDQGRSIPRPARRCRAGLPASSAPAATA